MAGPAIEATYKGYRFRSRLEARWAVFFDRLGLRWKYEDQGYLVGGLERPYLPDFWVEDLQAWVEVKGDPDALDLTLADDAVNPSSGLPRSDAWSNRNLLILGDIPDPDALHGWLHHLVRCQAPACDLLCACSSARIMTVAFQHISDRVADMAAKMRPAGDLPPRPEWPRAMLTQVAREEFFIPRSPQDIVTPRPCTYLRPDPVVTAAYRAARSARFEHGETPEPPPRGREPKPAGDLLKDRLGAILEDRKRDGAA